MLWRLQGRLGLMANLHLAAAMNDANLVRILLSHGADTNARTRIDDFTTPLEEAEKRSSLDAVKILRETKERC